MAESLKVKSAKGFAWNFGGTLLQQGIIFIISIFLARLLTPAEFGLVGMAMAFIAICQVFIDIGFTSALIQRQDNTNLTFSSIFYLNIFLGLLLTLGFYATAPLIGNFYGKPEITKLIKWLSLLFILNSFDLVQIAIFKKKLDFRTLTVRTFVATLVGGAAGIIAAFSGAGAYSLIIQKLFTSVLGSIMLWTTSEWKPDLRFSFKEVRKLTGYSTYVFLDNTLNSVFDQLDLLMVGKVFNPSVLGYYSRATTLKTQVTAYSSSSLTAVFFPVLSSMQDNDKEFARLYFKVISVIAFTSYALTGVLCVLGKDVILLLFGQKWLPSVPIFQVLILMACNPPINSMMKNAYYSKGKSKENFQIGLVRKALRVVPLIIMVYFGLFAFTIAFVIINYMITVLNVYFLNRFTGLSYREHFKKIFEGFLPMSVAIATFFYLEPNSTLLRMVYAIGFLGFYLAYAKIFASEAFDFLLGNILRVKSKILKR